MATRKPDYAEVINGRLVEVRRKRGYVEALVYESDKPEGEPVGEWEMPNALRYDLAAVARLAEGQTDR